MNCGECYKIAYDVQNKQQNYRLAALLYQIIVTRFPEELHCRYALDRLAELHKLGYSPDMDDKGLLQAAEQLLGGDVTAPEEYLKQLERKQRQQKEEQLREHGVKQYYEYKAISIADDNGKANIQAMNNHLNEMAVEGWKLHTALANKTGLDYSGRYSSTVSNQDETVLIFERLITLE